jgi:transposase
MIRMIDRHAVHALVKAGVSTKEIAQQMGVSERSVQRIAREPEVEGASDAQERRRRCVGRPAVPDPVRDRLRELIAADPAAPPLEFLRQLREEGASVGESTYYRVFRVEKEKLPAELMVRFEGVAGEFAQFDFGVADVRSARSWSRTSPDSTAPVVSSSSPTWANRSATGARRSM